MDRLPQLIPVYFGNYKRLVYLAQTDSENLQAMAREYAELLKLEYCYRFYGDVPLSESLEPALEYQA